jgi:hypothetical protein
MAGALGRVAPPDWEHVEKYPLTAEIRDEITVPRPVVIGVNWYPEFDEPFRDSSGHWRVKDPAPRSRPRGGHALCLKPLRVVDRESWWGWYDQVSEGICVSEACGRHQSLNNRRMYQPRWIYDRCKERDGIPNEEGTFVRTGFEVMRDLGLVRPIRGEQHKLRAHSLDDRKPVAGDGISVFRWARSIDDVLQVLGYGRYDFVDLLNSWGREGYPHYVRMSAAALERLWYEDGELAIATDR